MYEVMTFVTTVWSRVTAGGGVGSMVVVVQVPDV
jgi:hypothetical protein